MYYTLACAVTRQGKFFLIYDIDTTSKILCFMDTTID